MKYILPIIIFLFSIVSVFAEKINESIFVWKSNPNIDTGNLFLPHFEITPSASGTIQQEEVSILNTPTETGSETPKKPRAISYFQSLKYPVQANVFYYDESILRFVNRYRALSDRTYSPIDLMSISGSYINEAGRKSYLRSEAREALNLLAKAFYEEFRESLTVISGYRSAAYQQRLWDLGRCTSSLCAPPGYSEHQLGLAVDLFDATTEKEFESNKRYRKYIAWLKENAHLYGWTQSYQKGVAIDTYQVEPWHWRYVGIPMATRLHDLGWSYAEYVGFQESIQER